MDQRRRRASECTTENNSMRPGLQIQPCGSTPAIDTWHAWQFRSKNRQPDFVFFLSPVPAFAYVGLTCSVYFILFYLGGVDDWIGGRFGHALVLRMRSRMANCDGFPHRFPLEKQPVFTMKRHSKERKLPVRAKS